MVGELPVLPFPSMNENLFVVISLSGSFSALCVLYFSILEESEFSFVLSLSTSSGFLSVLIQSESPLNFPVKPLLCWYRLGLSSSKFGLFFSAFLNIAAFSKLFPPLVRPLLGSFLKVNPPPENLERDPELELLGWDWLSNRELLLELTPELRVSTFPLIIGWPTSMYSESFCS